MTCLRAGALPVLLALALPAPLLAEVILHEANSVVQGIFCMRDDTTEVPAENTIAGVIDNLPETPEFLWLGDTVPAALGISFGLHIDLPASVGTAVTFEVEHPPMGPDGITVESWSSDVVPESRRYVGFHFEKAYELVTGPWVMRAYAGDRLLYEAHWTVVPAEALPEIVGTCLGPDMLS